MRRRNDFEGIEMDCAEVRRLIPLASGGDVGEEEAEAVRAHTAVCVDCRRVWEKYLGDREALKGLSSLPLPSDVESRLHSFIDSVLRERSRKERLQPAARIARFVTVAAVILVALCAVLFSVFEEPKEGAEPKGPETVFERVEYYRTMRGAFENASLKKKVKATPAEREDCRLLDSADTSSFDF